MIKEKLINYLNNLIAQEKSLKTLTLSFCLGNYIAFSPYPFPFGHTGLAVLLSWFFNLKTSIVLLVAFLINNPWTAVPVYSFDYFFGYWIVHTIMGLSPCNPSWVEFINNILYHKLGIGSFCLWSFLIGGNLLGIITSIALYPLMKHIFSVLQTNNINKIYENHCTK